MIKGVQEQNVSACPKHFALNNQETRRMVVDSVVDERAKREIYYGAFEIAVRASDPWMIMCSYNRIDGTYACESTDLLTRLLRDAWGFSGAVVTDWGAMNDRVEALEAGLDLQMPADEGYGDSLIVQAVRDGRLDEGVLNQSVERLVRLALIAAENSREGAEGVGSDADAHHKLAHDAAAQSCVLLKNDSGLLPVRAGARIAVIGQFAKTPRYQGAGSSIINPSRMESVLDALDERGIPYEYAEGYSLEPWSGPDVRRIGEACEVARDKEVVLLFAGLPAECESEGFDRDTLDMPQSHNQLIEAVCAANPRTVVVLQLGAPVVMHWQDAVPSILLAYLGGQAGGGGCVDVLFGKVNPCGHLSESWPRALSDTPCHRYFPGNPKTVEYRESIFVGYRFYDAAERDVAWPFGHGLSYTDFEYSDLRLSSTSFKRGERLMASFTITNTGTAAGADVAQLYIGKQKSGLMRAPKELKGFEKVFLGPGENTTVCIELDDRSFAYFNALAGRWAIEGGEYRVSVGTSSREIVLDAIVEAQGDGLETSLAPLRESAPEYFALAKGTESVKDASTEGLSAQGAGAQGAESVDARDGLSIPDSSFEALLGCPIPPAHRQPGELLTINSTLGDAQHTFTGRILTSAIKRQMQKMLGNDNGVNDMAQAMFMEMPIRALGMFSNGALRPLQVEGLVDMMNGKLIRGLRKLRRKKQGA